MLAQVGSEITKQCVPEVAPAADVDDDATRFRLKQTPRNEYQVTYRIQFKCGLAVKRRELLWFVHGRGHVTLLRKSYYREQ